MTKYTLKKADIDTMVSGILTHGKDITYSHMRKKVFQAAENEDYIDFMLMDMYDSMLIMSRETDDEELKKIYLILTTLLRQLAHEIHTFYRNNKKKIKDDKRFLKVV